MTVKLVHLNKVGGDLFVIRPFQVPPGTLPANPAFPENSLPEGPPPQVGAGEVVVLVRDPEGVWHYAKLPAGTPPPVVIEPPIAPTPEPK